MRFVFRAIREAFAGARRRPLLPLAALSALAVCLTASALVGLVAWNLSRVAHTWSGDGQMTVYLDDDVSPARAQQLTDVVKKMPGVVDSRLVTSKEAYGRLHAALGSRGELLDGVEESFLPAAIEARLVPGTSALLRAHASFGRLSAAPGVDEVDLHAESVERVDAIRALVTRGAWLFALLSLVGTIYLVSTTIRVGVAARRDELAVLRLVGATEGFVRAPFLVEGIGVGFIGATLAAICTASLWHLAATRLAAALGDWAAPLTFFTWPVVVAGLVGGAMLGLIGARAAFTAAPDFAVRRSAPAGAGGGVRA